MISGYQGHRRPWPKHPCGDMMVMVMVIMMVVLTVMVNLAVVLAKDATQT